MSQRLSILEGQLGEANSSTNAMKEQLKKVNSELREVKSIAEEQRLEIALQNRTIERLEKRLSTAEATHYQEVGFESYSAITTKSKIFDPLFLYDPVGWLLQFFIDRKLMY